MVNVDRYSIHGAYGIYCMTLHPPSWPVANEGLGRDSLQKMSYHLAGDWHPGSEVHPMYKSFVQMYSIPIHRKVHLVFVTTWVLNQK